MKNIAHKASLAGLVGLVVVGVAGEAAAAGFQLREQSAEGLANAFAGSAAKASSPVVMWSNPAAMTLLHGHQIAGSLTWIAPQARFDGTGRSALRTSTGFKVGGDAIDDAAVGANYAMYSWSNDLKFGLAVTAPFGLRSSYPADWNGRYFGLASSVTSINVNPNVAFRVNKNLSVGAGVSVQWFEADLSGAMNQNAICAQLASSGRCSSALIGRLPDGWLRVKGDDIAVGFNVGALWEFSPQTRVGLAYRSAIRHNLQGDATTYGTLAALARPSGKIHADFTSPDTATASFYHAFDDKWAVMGDVQWTGWSRFQDLNVYYDANGGLVTGTHEGWRDTWFFSLGADYKWKPGHTVHVGVAYDMGAIPETSLRTPRIPDADRIWLSTGYTWEMNDNLRLSLGYTHIFAEKADIALSEAALGSLNGKYTGSVDILSTGFVYKF